MTKPRLLLIAGLLLIAAGMFFSVFVPPAAADPQKGAACRARLEGQSVQMLNRCSEAAFATAMTATNADAAAAAISSNNAAEVGTTVLGSFLLGIGFLLATTGGLMMWKAGQGPRADPIPSGVQRNR